MRSAFAFEVGKDQVSSDDVRVFRVSPNLRASRTHLLVTDEVQTWETQTLRHCSVSLPRGGGAVRMSLDECVCVCASLRHCEFQGRSSASSTKAVVQGGQFSALNHPLLQLCLVGGMHDCRSDTLYISCRTTVFFPQDTTFILGRQF